MLPKTVENLCILKYPDVCSKGYCKTTFQRHQIFCLFIFIYLIFFLPVETHDSICCNCKDDHLTCLYTFRMLNMFWVALLAYCQLALNFRGAVTFDGGNWPKILKWFNLLDLLAIVVFITVSNHQLWERHPIHDLPLSHISFWLTLSYALDYLTSIIIAISSMSTRIGYTLIPSKMLLSSWD